MSPPLHEVACCCTPHGIHIHMLIVDGSGTRCAFCSWPPYAATAVGHTKVLFGIHLESQGGGLYVCVCVCGEVGALLLCCQLTAGFPKLEPAVAVCISYHDS